jgi:hypothetical protein
VHSTVNSYETRVTSAAELRIPFASEQFREIWISIDRGPSLSALMNRNRGWLMYLRRDGDAGFSSRNPAFDDASSTVIEYRLTNGQVDEYPASWALPEQEIIRALEYFVDHGGGRTPSVHWHDDSTR